MPGQQTIPVIGVVGSPAQGRVPGPQGAPVPQGVRVPRRAQPLERGLQARTPVPDLRIAAAQLREVGGLSVQQVIRRAVLQQPAGKQVILQSGLDEEGQTVTLALVVPFGIPAAGLL